MEHLAAGDRHLKYYNRARRRLRDSGANGVWWTDAEDIPESDDEWDDLDSDGTLSRPATPGLKTAGRKGGGVLPKVLGARPRTNVNCSLEVFPKWLGNPVRGGRIFTEPYINIDHFSKLTFLTEGETSKVQLAQHNKSKRYFALKAVKKKWVYKARSFNQVVRQMRLHIDTSNRYITNVFRVFDHPSFVLLVQEYCVGGTLQGLLDRRSSALRPGRLSFFEARFYVAEIASAIHYLHTMRNIVYRNLMLDNIGISWNGHVKLLGFGRAEQVDPWQRWIRTKDEDMYGCIETLAPESLPPRLIFPFSDFIERLREKRARHHRSREAAHDDEESKADLDSDSQSSEQRIPEEEKHLYHSFESDWWSLGVCLFRMIHGFMPFGDSVTHDESDIARRVLAGATIQPFWRTRRTDRHHQRIGFTDLLRGLLEVDSEYRWTLEDLQACEFFAPIDDWMLLHNEIAPSLPRFAQVEGDSSSYAKQQKAKRKATKIGDYPEELQLAPSKEEVSYTYFAAACRDIMHEAMSKHSLTSKMQAETLMSESHVDVLRSKPDSKMLITLQKGFTRLEEKREYQRKIYLEAYRESKQHS